MISGYVCVRNGDELDYCWREAVESLLYVADDVLICDGESNDGTYEAALQWARRDPRVSVVSYPWPNPRQRVQWLVEWINAARSCLRQSMQLHLDADEVLDPGCRELVRDLAEARQCAWFWRLHYWQDAKHLAPPSLGCGERVVRLAPTDKWMVSDAPQGDDGKQGIVAAAVDGGPSLVIHHYGFLRHSAAFVEKSRIVQDAYFGSVDPRIAEAQEQTGDWKTRDYFAGDPLRVATVPHPPLMVPWLRERGHVV